MNDAAHDAFLIARAGSLGASEVADILRKGKNGEPSASRKNMLAKKVLERLSGKPTIGYVSRAMQDGLDREAEAKREYAFVTGNEVDPPGIIPHPAIIGAHASPDGLIGSDLIFEGKAPEPAQHMAMLRSGVVAADYLTQVQWQLACTRRVAADFVSFNPDFPVSMRLWIKRVPRDPARIVELETAVRAFLAEVEATVLELRERF